MQGVGYTVQSGADFHGLYEACNAIAAMKYEGREGVGRLVLARADHPNVELDLRLSPPVSLRNTRAVRKLVETATESLALVANPRELLGLGRLAGSYDEREQDMFEVLFLKHGEWELRHAGKPLMRVSFGSPRLPKERLPRKKVCGDMKRVFQDLEGETVNRLWRLIEVAAEQRHGTTVVISAAASEEATRLSPGAMPIEARPLDSKLVEAVGAIDGALLLDPSGVCHAIGVILDGVAEGRGDPARGARYNSVVRYVRTAKAPTFAVVVSEDGSVDAVPDLRPQIRRWEVDRRLEDLQELVKAAGQVDRKVFYATRQWLREHEFYLSADACAQVNDATKTLGTRLEQEQKEAGEGGIIVRQIFHELSPHEDMDESFFV